MKHVLNIAAGMDTGGQMFGMQRAFARYSTRFQMSSLASSTHRYGYPESIKPAATSRETRAMMERLWMDADVVHIHRNLLWFDKFDAKVQKPIVVNHHGSAFRAAPEDNLRLAKSIGAVSVVSTIDLLSYDPDLVWLPAPFDVGALLELRKRHKPRAGKVVRIAHSPSDRKLKSTPAVQVAVKRLAERYPIEFDLIEDVPWSECLARKAAADIVIDQFNLGYGCNSIEAWAMGIPVVAGTTSQVTRDRMLSILGELPFYEASEDTLYDRLRELVADKELRVKWGRKGLAYARRWHDDKAIVPRMETVYDQAAVQRLPVPLAHLPIPSPKNRLMQVRDNVGRIRLMTPARAKIRGYEAVA